LNDDRNEVADLRGAFVGEHCPRGAILPKRLRARGARGEVHKAKHAKRNQPGTVRFHIIERREHFAHPGPGHAGPFGKVDCARG
jgi:hypothetical protein